MVKKTEYFLKRIFWISRDPPTFWPKVKKYQFFLRLPLALKTCSLSDQGLNCTLEWVARAGIVLIKVQHISIPSGAPIFWRCLWQRNAKWYEKSPGYPLGNRNGLYYFFSHSPVLATHSTSHTHTYKSTVIHFSGPDSTEYFWHSSETEKGNGNSAVVKLLWQHMAVRGNVHCARCLFRIAGGGGAVGEPDLLSIFHLLSLSLR